MPPADTSITACILALNEERRIEDALRSLQAWTDEILVIDNERDDQTVEISRRYANKVLTAPRSLNFDAARNLAIDHAQGGWIFFLDADERVPPRLGPELRRLVQERGSEFEALLIPFKHYFCGRWVQHSGWWPGYTRPQLLKKGHFRYNERLHAGVEVNGRTLFFPADDPELAIIHLSFDDLHHYFDKLNRYTDGEAESLLADGASHSWQAQLAHFVHDWQLYYERGRGHEDGMHGFVLAFLSAVYRFASRAKLWDLRRQRGEIADSEALPTTLREMLELMARVAQEGAEQWLALSPPQDLNKDGSRWAEIYQRVDWNRIPDHYRTFTSMPFLARYLDMVLSLCPPGGRVLETGVGFGYGAIWLSQRGVQAEGIDYEPTIVERANRINRLLGGRATFRNGDIFDLSRSVQGPYDVIFHQGVLEHFSDDEIRTALRAQVAMTRRVVFSVPSVNYPFAPEFGNERLLSLEHWRALLAEFDVEALTYYGDPNLGGREHIMGVLRGTVADPSRMDDRLPIRRTHVESKMGSAIPAVQTAPVAPLVPLLWHAPLRDASGYADEARQFVLGLIQAGEAISVAPARWADEDAGIGPEVEALLETHTVPVDTPAELFVSHTLPDLQRPSPRARFNIARTMFETDRLPAGRAEALNAMDRIWVPSEFNRETFVRSGVDPTRIAVVPGAVDARPFGAVVEPWPVPGRERFRFLSVFDWTLHKGWDVLLEAFAAEFGADPEVGLILKTWSSHGYTLDGIRAQADALLEKKLGHPLAEFPNIHLWWERLPVGAMPRLYRAVDAFVLPTRGEGWCRPLMEAMAAGLPTIATAWSGLTAFHNARVGYPLKYQLWPISEAGGREIPIYAGHCWAEPDGTDLRQLMRRLVANPEDAHKKGMAARRAVTKRYSRSAVAAGLQAELARCRELAATRSAGTRPGPCLSPGTRTALSPAGAVERPSDGEDVPTPPVCPEASAAAPLAGAVPPSPSLRSPPVKPNANLLPRTQAPAIDFRSRLGRPLRVRWEGDQSLLSSLALVNRELCLGLLAADDVELSPVEQPSPWHALTERDDPRFGALFARRDAELAGPADITIRHQFPPNWERPPGGGKLVVIQPWEYGHLPRDWVEAARSQADEIWAYSRFVRDVYVRSGVPAEKVRVVPLGLNPLVFTPEGPRYPLPTRKSLRFLFVGGALARKGADLLLQAYQRAFTAADDVCLVVKDMGSRTFYHGQTFAEAFRRAQDDPRSPAILYLDEDLSEEQLAALYRACSCVVLPYRGEGFGLSPLEGMACGLPAIVTAGGPTDDYLDDSMGLRVPHYRRSSGTLRIGPFECTADPWMLEPDPQALVDALRWVYQHPEEARQRGEAARAHVQSVWTWDKGIDEVRRRMAELVVPHSPRPATRAKLWSEPRGHGKNGKKASGHCRRVELSLCMIVRDEAARIAQCLKSIAPWVDEMVVVDTGSRDRTRQIARDCGARVFDFPWTDSFAEARNQSVEQARGDWIFWMDADDVISADSGRQLRQLIRRHPKRDAAYQMQVHIPPGPGEFSPHVVDHVKLFPNRPELRFEHRIHEQILPSLRRAGLRVLLTDASVTHQNYDRSPEGQTKKRQRDFRLLELDLRDRPDHPFVLFNLGMTYLYATKEHEVAAHYLRRSLAVSDWQDSIVRKAYAMLTAARIGLAEWDEALAANEEGRSHYTDDAELLFQAGQLYQQVGRFDEARTALERLINGRDDPHYRSVDIGLRTYRGRHELALLFQRMGDGRHCEQILCEITAACPFYLPAQIDLVETLHTLGERNEARALLGRIGDVEEMADDLRRLRGLEGMT